MNEPDCPQCAAYRRVLAAEARVAEAQRELLEALLLGVALQESTIATFRESITRAVELARVHAAGPFAEPSVPLGRVQ
jgi:hypothetical protein